MIIQKVMGLALLTAGLNFANTIAVTGLDANLGLQESVWINEDGVNHNLYWAGGINIAVDGYNRVVFCVDLFTEIGFSNYNTTVSYADTPTLRRLAWLVENVFPTITTPAGGAALQLTMWDILHDGGDGLGVGAGRVSQSTDSANPTGSGLLTAVAQLEDWSYGQSSTNAIVYHNFTFSGNVPVQNLMGPWVFDAGPMPEAPEPGPLAMVLGGVVLMVAGKWFSARRRVKQSQAE